jgi:hypothetical protein
VLPSKGAVVSGASIVVGEWIRDRQIRKDGRKKAQKAQKTEKSLGLFLRFLRFFAAKFRAVSRGL